MNKYAVYKSDSYENIYSAVVKNFEAHNIREELSPDMHVVIKANLVTDKNPAFSVTTNPDFVYAIIKYLMEIGIKRITVADCPGGALLLFSKMREVYSKCGYLFLEEFAELNTDFTSVRINCDVDFKNKYFNIIKVVADADYVINAVKFKTHNATCITAGVKNNFGCIPGLEKPEFHAKYPNINDFSNMLVELAATVKPDFTIVDAVDIMEGNGPTNGKRRHLGLTFSSKDVFGIDKFIAEMLGIPVDKIPTIRASENKGYISSDYEMAGDTEFVLDKPIVLPDVINATSISKKSEARIKFIFSKLSNNFLKKIPEINSNCTRCCKCVMTCPAKALKNSSDKIILDKSLCIGCFCCDEVCPNHAINIVKKINLKK